MEEKTDVPRCPACGYTEEDQRIHGDHHLCRNAGKAPWEKRNAKSVEQSQAQSSLSIPSEFAKALSVEAQFPDGKIMEEKTDVPTCEHLNIIGHEWSSTCQQCGKTWQNRIPEGVLVRRDTNFGEVITNERYEDASMEESQTPPADALSLAADGLAEALRRFDGCYDGNSADMPRLSDFANAREKLAAYEAAKESR